MGPDDRLAGGGGRRARHRVDPSRRPRRPAAARLRLRRRLCARQRRWRDGRGGHLSRRRPVRPGRLGERGGSFGPAVHQGARQHVARHRGDGDDRRQRRQRQLPGGRGLERANPAGAGARQVLRRQRRRRRRHRMGGGRCRARCAAQPPPGAGDQSLAGRPPRVPAVHARRDRCGVCARRHARRGRLGRQLRKQPRSLSIVVPWRALDRCVDVRWRPQLVLELRRARGPGGTRRRRYLRDALRHPDAPQHGHDGAPGPTRRWRATAPAFRHRK